VHRVSRESETGLGQTEWILQEGQTWACACVRAKIDICYEVTRVTRVTRVTQVTQVTRVT
jgi:hypothetical protein